MEITQAESICPTCGHERLERFCPACGEERVASDELSVRRFIAAAVQESPIEGKLVRTLVELFRRPGLLTAEYFAGRRLPYVRPFRVYLFISIVFFFIIPGTGLFKYTLGEYEMLPFIGDTPSQMVRAELERTGETYEAYEKRFNETLSGQRKTMMLFLVPMFAVGMIPFFRRRRFGEHLVFSTHYFAVLLLYLGVIIQVFFALVFAALRAIVDIAPGFARPAADMLETENTLVIMIIIPAIIYLTIAARRAYGVTRRHAILAAVFLSWWQIVLIVYFYRAPLFFTTFYSLKWFN
jgi:hypothetical protein